LIDERTPLPDEWLRSALRALNGLQEKQLETIGSMPIIILYRTLSSTELALCTSSRAFPLPRHFAIARVRIRIDTPLLWGRLRDFRTGRKRKCSSSQRAKHFECRTVRMKPRHSGEHCDDRVTRIRSGSEMAKIPIRSFRAPAPSPESERG